jgi:hypothetical protein
MDASESGIIEDVAAALALIEGQAQQHHDARA